MKGSQKSYLKGLAHSLKPVVFIGHKGLTDTVIRSTDEALDTHELIKIKFNDFKEKAQKAEMTEKIGNATRSEMIGMVGHVATFYRQNDDPEKRKIIVPESSAEKNMKSRKGAKLNAHL